MFHSGRRAITLMAREEGRQGRSGFEDRLHSGHDSATESARDIGRVRRRSESALDHEGVNTLRPLDWCHHPEAEEAAVTDDQWSWDWRTTRRRSGLSGSAGKKSAAISALTTQGRLA
jgi:hypothetical protein